MTWVARAATEEWGSGKEFWVTLSRRGWEILIKAKVSEDESDYILRGLLSVYW